MRRLIFRLRESLLAVPVAIVIGCVVLAVVALYADANHADLLDLWPVVLHTSVPGGRAIATTVAGATITVAAIVFSVTALSTQMAANQYSPRALGGFFEDRLQQSIIGLVVGTFTYSLLVLASLSTAITDGSEATPSLSVTVDMALGVASAVGIVAYINHSLHRMQIDSVVRRIASASIASIKRYLAEPGEQETNGGHSPQGESYPIQATRNGWIVDIDTTAALSALPEGTTARVDVRLGKAVSEGDRLVTLWPEPHEDWNGESRVRNAIVTAPDRSLDLDPTFGMRQLVDIALRALSPGVNDPTTAVDVIYHLKTPVRTVLVSDAPRRVFSGDGDRRLFLAQTPGRSEYVHLGFSEIRLAAKGHPTVLKALLEVLRSLKADLEQEGLEGRMDAVIEELELTVEVARASGLSEPDLKRVLGPDAAHR